MLHLLGLRRVPCDITGYQVLLRAYAEKFNWGYCDHYPNLGLIQRFFSFTLYLLVRHGDQWRENTFYENAFVRAFPSIMDGVKSGFHESPEETVRGAYSLRCLRRFAEFLGLVEIGGDVEQSYGRVFKLRRTPLLDDAVRFHLWS